MSEIATTCIVIFIFLNKVIVVTYHWFVNFLCDFYMLYISVIKWQVVKTYLSNMTLYWHHIDIDKSTINILSGFFLIFCSKCVSQRISHLRLLLWYDIALRNPFLQNKSTIVYICMCDNFLRHTINVIYIVVNIIIFYHIYDISK